MRREVVAVAATASTQRRFISTKLEDATSADIELLQAVRPPYKRTSHRDLLICFSQRLFDANTTFVEGLRANGFFVVRRPANWNATGSAEFAGAVVELDQHFIGSSVATTGHESGTPGLDGARSTVDGYRYNRIMRLHEDYLKDRRGSTVSAAPRKYLVLAIEDTPGAVAAAAAEGACVVGIAETSIGVNSLLGSGAKIAARSIDELLTQYNIRGYHELQYLPYTLEFENIASKKAGYPTSLIDLLHGRYTATGVDVTNSKESPRLVHRESLGLRHGSLADMYINNIGWTEDSSGNWRLNTRNFERDILRMFARLYGVPETEVRGFTTSGGTEGNFTGLWWLRDYLSAKSADGNTRPVVMMSEHAHYSCNKACQQLGLEPHYYKPNWDGTTDLAAFEASLEALRAKRPSSPIILLATAGTTQTGAVESLGDMTAVLKRIVAGAVPTATHLDAALLGPVLPYVKPWGNDVRIFHELGVATMALSGHKFVGSSAVCGLCITTKTFLDDYKSVVQQHAVSYLGGLHDITPSGSRSGFSTLSFHNTLCWLDFHRDAQRLQSVIRQCYKNRDTLIRVLSNVFGPENVICPPHSLNIVFPRPSQRTVNEFSLMPVDLGDGVERAGVCCLLNIHERLIRNIEDALRLEKTPPGSAPGRA